MAKRGLAAAFVLIMVCSMTACGKKGGTETTQATEAVETETEMQETERAEKGETETALEMPEYVSAFDLGEISEYVELGEYRGIEVTAADMEVTDEDIEEELKAQVENAVPSYEEITEGTVKNGDVVNIDYEGRMNGEVFQGGTDSAFNLTIGSGQFISGFEDGLIGKTVGDTVVLKLNFPDPYTPNPDYSGKPVEFTVTINYVRGDEIPNELNDAFVERLTNGLYKTVDEYRAYIKSEMAESRTEDARVGKINEAWEKVEANATFKKDAEELIQYNYDTQLYQVESMMNAYGMDMETYLSAIGTTQEQFQKDLMDYADQSARWQLLVRAIVEAENLELTEEEYKNGLEHVAEETGMSVESLQTNYSETMLRDILRQEAVQDFLEATVVEVPAEE